MLCLIMFSLTYALYASVGSCLLYLMDQGGCKLANYTSFYTRIIHQYFEAGGSLKDHILEEA